MPAIKKANAFNRIFDPEFLQARKDLAPVELHAAQGKIEEVKKALLKEREEGVKHNVDPILVAKNRDGNDLLLLAVANGHTSVAQLLITQKANVHTKNVQRMDALDYAIMEGVQSPMSKVVLSNCDYVVPEVFDGPFDRDCRRAIQDLHESGHRMARTQMLGKRPDFSNLFAHETDYRKEWVSNLRYLAATVRKGILLLNDSIGYLERDALLSGAFEVPIQQRYLYFPEAKEVKKFTNCLRGKYQHEIEKRVVQTALCGEAMAVQALLKAHANPNIEDPHGQTVLQCACSNGDLQTLKCLLVAKAGINTQNLNGFTALHVAASRNKAEAVSVLIKAKADLFARSHKGHSVLDFVKHENHSETLAVVQEERDRRKEDKAKAKGPQKPTPGGYPMR